MRRIIRPFKVLRHRNYRVLVTGHLVSRIGTEMQTVAINWHIYNLIGNPLSLGVIGLARFLPIIAFSPLGGLVSDRFDRRKVMLVSQIFLALFSGVLAYFTIRGAASQYIIYIIIAANSAFSAFDTPARQSILPQLVPPDDLINASSLNVIIWNAAIVAGPALSGFVIASSGEGTVYLLNTLSFLAIIISLLKLRLPDIKPDHTVGLSGKSLKEGFSFVFKTPLIWSTMVLDFIATFFGTANVLMPVFAKDILRVGARGLGVLYASTSLGAVLSGLFVSSLKKLNNQGKVLLLAVLIYGGAMILFGLSRNFYLSMLFLFFAGAGDAVSTIIRNTVRQLATPDRLRGRMVSINMVFFMGGPQLGEAEAGAAAWLIGTQASVVLGGAGTVFTTILIAILVPALRKYKGHELMMK